MMATSFLQFCMCIPAETSMTSSWECAVVNWLDILWFTFDLKVVNQHKLTAASRRLPSPVYEAGS